MNKDLPCLSIDVVLGGPEACTQLASWVQRRKTFQRDTENAWQTPRVCLLN